MESVVTTKVFQLKSYYRSEEGCSWGASDYVFNVYENGILVRSITVRGLRRDDALSMFPDSEFIWKSDDN